MDSQNDDLDIIIDQQRNNLVQMQSSNSNLGASLNGDCFVQCHHPHHLVSTNSFEFNPATSLSDDSGLPHTNSSISSGDSSRLGLCKFEFELAESDGEVSQFDSLDNCSDGGMSAENFNTLKKGPLAPIDPPPEFQDSPQTTLLRSPVLQDYAQTLIKNIIIEASSIFSKIPDNLKDFSAEFQEHYADFGCLRNKNFNGSNLNDIKIMKKICSNQMYASDTMLNRTYKLSDNIYDEPNNDYNSSSDEAAIHDRECNNKINLNNILHQGYKVHSNTIKSKENSLCLKNDMYPKRLSSISVKNSAQAVSSFENFGNDFLLQYNNFGSSKLPIGCSNSYGCGDSYSKKRTPPKSTLYSPLHHHPGSNLSTGNRPNSRNSLTSRLSSSHNSLSVPTSNKADDSIFITQAMSHDALMGREISDFYNVPIDSDIYALPVDVIKPDVSLFDNKTVSSNRTQQQSQQRSKLKYIRNNKKRRKNAMEIMTTCGGEKTTRLKMSKTSDKRHSVPENTIEPMHMTLDEAKRFYHSYYSSTSDSSESGCKNVMRQNKKFTLTNGKSKIAETLSQHHVGQQQSLQQQQQQQQQQLNNQTIKSTNKSMTVNLKNKKISTKDDTIANNNNINNNNNNNNNNNINNNNKFGTQNHHHHNSNNKKTQFSIHLNLKQKFCSIFRFKKPSSNTTSHINNNSQLDNNCDYVANQQISSDLNASNAGGGVINNRQNIISRALPPLPIRDGINLDGSTASQEDEVKEEGLVKMDFAANLEKIKQYGWYWGPISSEGAEKILSNEPDGSFIVRDSSDDHYIFSLTFKLNNHVRHVRIEQDQGTFSFGSFAKFNSRTIVEFIEKAVEHSRSGRYLFFLHRRPEHGPMRVQLTNPVSRFKHIQSLQHMCRFVILKVVVRKDLIQTLPLPRRILDYLSYKNCYSEQIESDSSVSQASNDANSS